MTDLKQKIIMITGSTRGIGRAMALRFAQDGARIVVLGKTDKPHPKLEGTIHSVADEIKQAGGEAMPLVLDVRDESAIERVVAQVVEQWGGIDVLINNASAISLTPTLQTPMRRFDLMMGVNVRGTFACSQACLPHLMKSDNPHILNIAPPLHMEAKWFANHLAYTYSKYGMSVCTLGMSAEFKQQGIAVNSLWPCSTIATAAVQVNFPPEILAASRKPEIMSDAAYAVIIRDAKQCTGHFFTDESVLTEAGVTDFSHYMLNPDLEPFKDLYID